MLRHIILVSLFSATILVSCGNENQQDQLKVCTRTIENRIDSTEVCMSTYVCSQGALNWFQIHLCLCWENLCMCFFKRSTSICKNLVDKSCELKGGMVITSPGICNFKSNTRNRLLFPEQDKKD